MPDHDLAGVALFEINGGMCDLLTSKLSEVLGHSREAGDAQDIAPKCGVGYLEVIFILDMTYTEHTVHHGTTFFDELLILSLFRLALLGGRFTPILSHLRGVYCGSVLLDGVCFDDVVATGLHRSSQHQTYSY